MREFFRCHLQRIGGLLCLGFRCRWSPSDGDCDNKPPSQVSLNTNQRPKILCSFRALRRAITRHPSIRVGKSDWTRDETLRRPRDAWTSTIVGCRFNAASRIYTCVLGQYGITPAKRYMWTGPTQQHAHMWTASEAMSKDQHLTNI